MKQILLFLFFFLLGLTQIHAQAVYLGILSIDGTEKSVNIQDLKNITFFDSNLNLNYWSGTNESLPTNSIRKLIFTSATGLHKLDDNKIITVYPNPVIDFIALKNTSANNINVSIYSITGALILSQQQLSATQTINVSNLQKGLYFLKVNNQVIKFIKQ
ncbi:hypothetical protein TRIP_D260168 [uncultured Paludibacter sp.]|uniref:Secretion system C-terminal sorting domain-containing protein n=1 Tax=uncultured Paludibacter sp. TaxID=497635 RepID=A0A653A9T4_9BACT|nr:hypothetical protein TRIP_D260168 [uncultured Paludibacter sp.]